MAYSWQTLTGGNDNTQQQSTPGTKRYSWQSLTAQDDEEEEKKKNTVKTAVKATAKATTKTPIDQTLKVIDTNNKTLGDFWLGNNLIPAYKEDSALAKVGKGIVNYGLGTVANIFGAPQQAIMQGDRAAVNAVTGKKQDFSQMSFGKDILGAKEDNLLTTAIGTALDPTTYIGGGIVDDLTRAGIVGAGAKAGTAENLAANAARGQRAVKGAKAVNQTSREYISAERNMAKKDAVKTPDVIYATKNGVAVDNINRTALPAGKPQPAKKVLLLTEGNSGLALPERTTSKIELGPATSKAKESYPADIYVDQYGHASADPGTFPANIKQLPAGKTTKKVVSKRNVDTPNMLTPKEAKKLGLDTRQMGRQISSGEYAAKGTADYINDIRPRDNATGIEPSIYERAKGQIENPSLPLQRKKAYESPQPDYSLGKGRTDNINAPLAGRMPAAEAVKPSFDTVVPESIRNKMNTQKGVQASKKVIGAEPANIPEGQVESGYSVNSRTDLNNPDQLRDAVTDNPFTHVQKHGVDTIAKAQAIFEKGNGTSELYTSFSKNEYKPEMVPLSKLIARDMAAKGDVHGARNILSDTANKLTEAGQFTQAAKLLRESDPETFLMTVDKQLKTLNEQGLKQYGKKWTNVDLTPEELSGIQSLPRGDEAAYETMMNQIGGRISQQLPSSGLEKFDAWRRTAMLLNPKTHIRNIGGNVTMAGLRKTADTIGAGLEKLFKVPEGERTKSVGWSLDKNLSSTVNAEWETAKKDLASNSRWGIEIGNLKSFGRDKRIFQNGALNKVDTFGKNTLNWEDNLFSERAYKDALGGFMKANNLSEVTDGAREYAKRRADEATFKQMNSFASWIQQQKSKGGIVGKGIDAALPFVKTPANIVVNSLNYSPAGLVKALYSKASGKSAATVIEDLSKGLTGTGVAGLGYFLASVGWARSEKGNSKNAEGLLQASGDRPYSIHTPFGSYTFDWALPMAAPLAMGMALYQSLAKKDGIDFDAVNKAIATGGDTIFNMSMLQTVKSFFGGAGGSATEQIMGLPVSYLQQAMPTVLGQTARTIDDTKRSTYDTTGFGKFTRQLASKVPGLSFTLEPQLDIWGRKISNGGALQQFISPGYFSQNDNDPVTKEVKRIYQATNETDFLPKLTSGSFGDGKGNTVELTPKQLTQFQQEMGTKNYRDIMVLINSNGYKNAKDDVVRSKMIRTITDRNNEIEKKKFIPLK